MKLQVVRVLLTVCLVLVALLSGTQRSSRGAVPELHFLYGSGSGTGGKSITLRVELTSPASQGGVRVRLATSNVAIQVPGSVLVPAGQTDLTFYAPTTPVDVDTPVTVQAEFGGVVRARQVLVKAPALSSLSVQSRMRSGGSGKITLFLTGPAPEGGISVELKSNRPSLLVPQSPVVIPQGRTSKTVIVPVGPVKTDTPVNLIAQMSGIKLVTSTLIRNYDLPLPTSTPSATATTIPTATPSQSPTLTATTTVHTVTASPPGATATPGLITPTPTPTATGSVTQTATSIPTVTATGTIAATATHTPGSLQSIDFQIRGGLSIVLKGSVVSFDVCLEQVPATDQFVSFRSSNETVVLQEDIDPVFWIFPASGGEIGRCHKVEMTGQSEPSDNLGVGEVNLIANWNGAEFSSPVVTFRLPEPTATESVPPMVTVTPTASTTPSPLPTEVPATNTPSPTPSAIPSTSTATPEPTVTPTVIITPSTSTATASAAVTPTPTSTQITATATPTFSSPTATSTATATIAPQTPTPSATSSPTPTPTTLPPTSTPTTTASPTSSPTVTPTAEQATATLTLAPPTPTSTSTPSAEPVTITLLEAGTTFVRGSTVHFSVCLSTAFTSPTFVSFKSGNGTVVEDSGITPSSDVPSPGQCLSVEMIGRSGPGQFGIGEGFLVANVLGSDIQGPLVTFVAEE